jgi:hypothetical protein
MSCHSEEVWEDVGALWRRFEQLNRRVRELEARLGAVESERQASARIINGNERAIYESEVGR